MISLFSTAYLPPISYISTLLKAENVIMEQHEHYIKQTYRNRTEIYGANGLLPLTIPINHHDLFSIPIKEVKISYEQPWQKIHWRSIESAYRNSPYFEYYEDQLKVFYEKEYVHLLEWNNELLNLMLNILGADKKILFTDSYLPPYPPKGGEKSGTISDLRNEFKPGGKISSLASSQNVTKALPLGGLGRLYKQVFSERHGFIPDLSIIDLIFNEGPKTIQLMC